MVMGSLLPEEGEGNDRAVAAAYPLPPRTPSPRGVLQHQDAAFEQRLGPHRPAEHEGDDSRPPIPTTLPDEFWVGQP
jgi:hypothetical protein